MELRTETLQGDTDHVAVMELVAGAALAKIEPEAVQQLYIFGPQARRVWSEVEEPLSSVIGINDQQ